MTPSEEKLIFELHSKWGNRWSKIARKLPGRTDNEIKNYWRTFMRKEAQEQKKKSISTSSSPSTSINGSFSEAGSVIAETKEDIFDGKTSTEYGKTELGEDKDSGKVYSMDEIWRNIEERSNLWCPTMATPLSTWDNDYSWWQINEEERLFMQQPHSFLFQSYLIGS